MGRSRSRDRRAGIGAAARDDGARGRTNCATLVIGCVLSRSSVCGSIVNGNGSARRRRWLRDPVALPPAQSGSAGWPFIALTRIESSPIVPGSGAWCVRRGTSSPVRRVYCANPWRTHFWAGQATSHFPASRMPAARHLAENFRCDRLISAACFCRSGTTADR